MDHDGKKWEKVREHLLLGEHESLAEAMHKVAREENVPSDVLRNFVSSVEGVLRLSQVALAATIETPCEELVEVYIRQLALGAFEHQTHAIERVEQWFETVPQHRSRIREALQSNLGSKPAWVWFLSALVLHRVFGDMCWSEAASAIAHSDRQRPTIRSRVEEAITTEECEAIRAELLNIGADPRLTSEEEAWARHRHYVQKGKKSREEG